MVASLRWRAGEGLPWQCAGPWFRRQLCVARPALDAQRISGAPVKPPFRPRRARDVTRKGEIAPHASRADSTLGGLLWSLCKSGSNCCGVLCLRSSVACAFLILVGVHVGRASVALRYGVLVALVLRSVVLVAL